MADNNYGLGPKKQKPTLDTKKPLKDSAREMISYAMESMSPKIVKLEPGESEQPEDDPTGESDGSLTPPKRPVDNSDSDFPPFIDPRDTDAFKTVVIYKGTGGDKWQYSHSASGAIQAWKPDESDPSGYKTFDVDPESKAGKAILAAIKSGAIVKR